MRELVARYLSRSISRRGFLKGLTTAGISLASAESILESLVPIAHAQGTRGIPPEAIKMVEGTGAECFAEQLIASGVKYVFGNSASEDAQFYEALVDRPQLKYILTPHEGPGAAMAAGYIKASGEPTIVMQAAVVGMANAIGQIFNAHKEQTPLVVYSYRTDQSRRAGRDGFEEVLNQEQIVQPITKYTWLSRRPDMIPETIRRGFKAAWTPPYGPAYISWHSDYNDESVRTEIIPEGHPLWVGNVAGGGLNSLTWPKGYDVVLNVGNKFQHNGANPIVPRGPKFIDMRIDHWSMGNVMLTEVPLVADVGYGLDDMIAAVEQLLTASLKQKAANRADETKKFHERA